MQNLTPEQLLKLLQELPEWKDLTNQVKELKEKVQKLKEPHPNKRKILEDTSAKRQNN